MAGSDYEAETITVYAKRIRNAIEAQGGKAGASESHDAGNDTRRDENGDQLDRFPFPLRSGQMAELKLPDRLDKTGADRLSGFLRALQYEPQVQTPEHTGESGREAA